MNAAAEMLHALGVAGDTSVPDPIDPEHCVITFHCDAHGQHCTSSRQCSKNVGAMRAAGAGAASITIPSCWNFAMTVVPSGTSSVQAVFSNPAFQNMTYGLIGANGSQSVSGTYVSPNDWAVPDQISDGFNTVTVTSVAAVSLNTNCQLGLLKNLPKIGLPKGYQAPVGLTNPKGGNGGYQKGGTTATGPASAAGWSTQKKVLVIGGTVVGVGAAGALAWYLFL
jgi:hypothetical protein